MAKPLNLDSTIGFAFLDECYHTWFVALSGELERLTCGVIAARLLVAARNGDYDMGKLGELGDRIKRMHDRHDKEADALAVKLDEIEKSEAPAFARSHNVLDAKRADIVALEDDIKQLSNGLPLAE